MRFKLAFLILRNSSNQNITISIKPNQQTLFIFSHKPTIFIGIVIKKNNQNKKRKIIKNYYNTTFTKFIYKTFYQLNKLPEL